ncbi:MAG: hypothetical protein ACE5O2_05090 [Armatimonadota bacterium]
MRSLTVCVCWCLATNRSYAQERLPAFEDLPQPQPAPATPGPAYQPPIDDSLVPVEGAPVIYERTADAGPDQTFFAVGERLTGDLFVWGRDDSRDGGRRWQARPQLVNTGYLAATLAERAYDAPFLVWVRNDAGWSRPFRLNVPQPWWYWPRDPVPGERVRVFGRDLGRRPDRTTTFLYLLQPGKVGRWVDVEDCDKYSATARIPRDVAPGEYQLWAHAGCAGRFGWSLPLTFRVAPRAERNDHEVVLSPARPGEASPDLKRAISDVAAQGGGVLRLQAGTYTFRGTLEVPVGVTIAGAGARKTRLQLLQSKSTDFARSSSGGWNRGVGRIHTVGDTIEYDVRAPVAGAWHVWLRYATEMSPWNQPGVSGNMTLQVDDGKPVPLQNLPNTGSFGNFKWARSATVDLTEGEHRLRWRNVKGGGINLDAYVFALDADYEPSDEPWPRSGPRVIVMQAEDAVRFDSREGVLPGRMYAAVWLAGDRAGLLDLTISGNPQVSSGVLIRSPEPLTWVRGCRIERCRISDVEAKTVDSAGVRLVRAESAVVRENEIWGRAPLWLSAVRHCDLSDNRLVPVTRYGDNALAAIVGRTDVIEECVIEDNLVASPPGAEAGGPQVMRLIWLSTGRGSVTRNWIARNGVVAPSGPGAAQGAGQMRFGGVAGLEQNVGEMILFEANHRTMYFGPLVAADRQSITLPATVPPTPDDRLGSVKREQLAHDAEGNETPYWPPDEDDGSPEPPSGQYFVSVFDGVGQGQTRRVLAREEQRLLLDRPWRTPPAAGSIVGIGTGYYQNLVVGNYTSDGMTGIQLWISCIENVVSGNTIARMRRPAIYLYANGTTLASSMPRTWNRGISPLFFNVIEGNRSDECSAGVLLTSGDFSQIPIEFPRALGNVIRHNSFVRQRTEGVIITSRKPQPAEGDVSPSILGTIVEHNVVRDAPVAYRSAQNSDGVVFRRNHAYFWYPVSNTSKPLVGFQVDRPGADVVIEANTVEGKVGELNPSGVIAVKRAEGE